MRYLHYTIIIGLVTTVLISSCGDDAFSQIAEIELPEHQPRTVMSLHLVAGDQMMNPYIGQSREITEDEVANGPDGTLKLYQNGVEIANGEYATGANRISGFELIADNPVATAPGDVFQLDGVVGELGTATATQVMPTPPNINLISYTIDGGLNLDGDRVDELIVDIIDPGTEDNIYAFDVGFYLTRVENCGGNTCDTFRFFRSVYTESIDPLVEDAYDLGNLLRDATFDGSTYRLRLLVENIDNNREEPMWLRVLSLTEDGYRYVVSRAAFEDARSDPFSEPVNVHDNIENGYGFFMVSNLTELIVQE